MAIKNKKGLVFTFFSFFLILIIFMFGSFYVFDESYNRDSSFKQARVLYLDNEVRYFKDVYVKSLLEYSSYNTMKALINYSYNNHELSNNYSGLKKLFKEGLINGTFNNVSHPLMNNSNLTNLLGLYSTNFLDTHKAIMTYDILGVNIFEENHYFVSVQIFGVLNVTSIDNLSNWEIEDEFEIAIPIYDLDDPQFILRSNVSIPIVSSENQFGAFTNWTYETFNETLYNMYATIYVDSAYKYSIGDSFLIRLLNYSNIMFKDTSLFLSFDNDEEDLEIYDRSLRNFDLFHYGNTILHLTFDNETSYNTSHILDATSYENNGEIDSGTFVTSGCVSSECFDFNSVGNGIEIPNNPVFNLSGGFSLSVWTNFDNITESPVEVLMNKTDEFSLRKFVSLGIPHIEFSGYDGSNFDPLITTNISDAQSTDWINFIVTYNTSHISVYKDGIIINTSWRGQLELDLGGEIFLGQGLNGMLDEINIYTKALDYNEVTQIYSNSQATFIDYVDSVFDIGLDFDGQDDELRVDTFFLDGETLDEFSIQTWFEIDEFTNNNTYILKFNSTNGQASLRINYTDRLIFSFYDDNSVFIELTHDINFTEDVINYVGIVYNGSNISMHLNDNLVDMTNWSDSLTIDSGIVLGENFSGIIDEFKIHNRSLSFEEIDMNYFNFNSFGKGCCNYLTLMNPHTLNYNTTSYEDNVSYSSRLFYNHYDFGSDDNITLFVLNNFSSTDTGVIYHNLKVDSCLMRAFNIFDYPENYTYNEVLIGFDEINCTQLIERGIY